MPTTASKRQGRRRPNHKLVALRVNDGLSREQLAYRANVGRETVRLAESGFLPSPRVQFALAGVFDLRPLDLWPIEMQRKVR